MRDLATRKSVEEAVALYFAGKISVDEAFRRAYGPDPRAEGDHSAAAVPAAAKRAGGKPRRKRSK